MKKCWKDKEKTKMLSFGYLNFFSTHVPVKSVPLHPFFTKTEHTTFKYYIYGFS